MRHRKKSKCPLGGGANPCAFCRLHRATLTVTQMKNRECLRKKCQHFRPWKQHPYWEARAREKVLKQERKEARKNGQLV